MSDNEVSQWFDGLLLEDEAKDLVAATQEYVDKLLGRVASLEAEVLRLREAQVDGRIAGLNQAITEWRDTGRLDETRATLARLFGHRASAPTSGQGAAATATTAETPRMVCDLEGDDACACSTTGTCRCVAEPVCSGPLVGSLIEPEFECATCGAQMIAAPSPAARPPSDTCARCGGLRTVPTPATMKPCPDCTTPRKEGP